MIRRSLLLAALAVSCGGSPAPVSPPPPPPVTPPPDAGATDAAPPKAANVERLRGKLGPKADVTATDDGRVLTIKWSEPGPGSAQPPLEQLTAWLRANGSLLGRGAVGDRITRKVIGGTEEPVSVVFTHIEPGGACSHLNVVAAYQKVAGGRAPVLMGFACPEAPDEVKQNAADRSAADEIAQQRKAQELAADPLVAWAKGEGAAVQELTMDGDTKRLLLARPLAIKGDREAFVKGLATRAARAGGLPDLDKVELDRQVDGNKKDRFRSLVLRLAKPPLDGRCIDPRVEVGLSGNDWDVVASVDVTCATEPTDGNKPPADPSRALPKAASGSVEHVAFCDSMSWNTRSHHGIVVDKRGDVFGYSSAPMTVPKTAYELAVLARHGRTYLGTLPPAEVDKLVALTPRVDAEPLARGKQAGADMAAGGCSLVRATGGFVTLGDFGSDTSQRKGAASKEAAAIVGKAEAMRK